MTGESKKDRKEGDIKGMSGDQRRPDRITAERSGAAPCVCIQADVAEDSESSGARTNLSGISYS